jgi:2-succinyl-5-enolpyruvyl-6-hydroxy-3-cyclohexene-1-carboxylate synthase
MSCAMTRPQDLQATFCATLVDEWARDGVEHAVVCPGSRSTPLALALAGDDRIQVHVHQDERSGGFLALGLAAATGEAVVVLTTSGTAAVELHPAVVEADLSGVPLLLCTANRPPELQDVGAPQAIDQAQLYGRAVRWFHAPGVADEAASGTWRNLAARAHAEATGNAPGPVHLDLAFREPLLGTPAELPPSRPTGGAWVWRPSGGEPEAAVVDLAGDLAGRRGLIVAGAGSGQRALVARVADALGWPVLASPAAPVWGATETIAGVDALLRTDPDLAPEVVVHLGVPLASRVAGEWLARTDAVHVVVAGPSRWVDPHRTASIVLPWAPEAVVERWADDTAGVTAVDGGEWARRWQRLGAAASSAIDAVLDGEPRSEPAIARALVRALPAGASLVASSSMPIRDLEWYVQPEVELAVHANRGANGIDGVVSTAVGIALAEPDRPSALLIGDLAFLHDSNGLLGAAARGVDLVVVVVDNDGGGIFSFLPQAETVDDDRFEQLFGTPHGLDLVALARSYGVTAVDVEGDVEPAVRDALVAGGVHVLVAKTDRAANRAVHQRLNEAVAEAVAGL